MEDSDETPKDLGHRRYHCSRIRWGWHCSRSYSGKKVTGGGWIETVENNQPNLQVYQNYPASSASWKVRVRNDSATAENLTAYAVCVD
jgi:hypothetical protein